MAGFVIPKDIYVYILIHRLRWYNYVHCNLFGKYSEILCQKHIRTYKGSHFLNLREGVNSTGCRWLSSWPQTYILWCLNSRFHKLLPKGNAELLDFCLLSAVEDDWQEQCQAWWRPRIIYAKVCQMSLVQENVANTEIVSNNCTLHCSWTNHLLLASKLGTAHVYVRMSLWAVFHVCACTCYVNTVCFSVLTIFMHSVHLCQCAHIHARLHTFVSAFCLLCVCTNLLTHNLMYN